MKKQKHAFGRLKHSHRLVMAALATVSFSNIYALTIQEDFTGGQTQNSWLMPLPGDGLSIWSYRPAINQACMTAGSTVPTLPLATPTVAGTPPRCSTGNDVLGQGALRLTRPAHHQVGGIVSNFTFPTDEGVEISFTTYTWGGNGADGMSFFLADGSKPATLGASGGALGYPCTNVPFPFTGNGNPIFSGVDHGYLAVGMDEYGNFINSDDNTDTGAVNRRLVKNAIGIRGTGVINYGYLSNPDRFLQDVYTSRGWGTVPAATKAAWAADWATTPTNYTRNDQIARNKMWNICRLGRLEVPSSFLPINQTHVMETNAARQRAGRPLLPTNSPYRLYNYAYLGHIQLSSRIDSPAPATTSRATAKAMLYRIKITPGGLASVWVSENGGAYRTVIEDMDVVAVNGPLPNSFRFGFMGSTGGSHNNHDVLCFKANPATESQGDASINLPDARVVSDTQLFLSEFSQQYWTGQLKAQNLVESGDSYYVNPVANWDAACTLNGTVTFPSSGSTPVTTCSSTNTIVTPQARSSRVFWSWNGAGIPLGWHNLSAAQQNSLLTPANPAAGVVGDSPILGEQRLEYLKGDRSNEEASMGDGKPFRKRRSLLADIINSSPTWVGSPSKTEYQRTWNDMRISGSAMPENSGQSYSDFAALRKHRTHVVYAGSNDGFMHGFRAGKYRADGTLDTSTNDGREVVSYMPAAVLSRIHHPTDTARRFSGNQYAHNYYNDSAPAVGDVFYQGHWHTWMLSGLGTGGNTMYALDITDPDNFTTASAATNVKGEWSFDAADPIWRHLGNTYGTPVFGRFHDGNWGAVFGNGWCATADQNNGNCTASTGPAGIYVMSINQATGIPSFRFISTGENGTDANNPNGIAYVTPVDLDGDQIYDYAYAGDLKGNVWRFDLTSGSSATWAAQQPQKIFTTAAGQPITTKIIVSNDERAGILDPILTFGTGKRQEGYLSGITTYADSQQAVYGLRDRQARSFPSGGTATASIAMSTLQTKVTSGDQLADSPIDWGTQNGWRMNLGSVTIGANTMYEQVVYNMHLEQNKYIILNSYIDGSNPVLSCNAVKSTGYTYPLIAASGNGIKGFLDNNPSTEPFRMQLNGSGVPMILHTNDGRTIMVVKTIDGKYETMRVYFPELPPNVRRLSWREIF